MAQKLISINLKHKSSQYHAQIGSQLAEPKHRRYHLHFKKKLKFSFVHANKNKKIVNEKKILIDYTNN